MVIRKSNSIVNTLHVLLPLANTVVLFFLGFLGAMRDGHGALLATIDKNDLVVVLCRRRRRAAVRMRNALVLVRIRTGEIDRLVNIAATTLLVISCNRRWRRGCH